MLARFGLAVVFGLCLLSSAMAQQQSDADKIRGVWSVVCAHSDGHRMLLYQACGMVITIDGERIVMQEAGRRTASAILYKLDPTQQPKAIDLVCPSPHAEQSTYLGIYQFDGNLLRLTWRIGGGPRPMTFSSVPEPGLALLVLKKERGE